METKDERVIYASDDILPYTEHEKLMAIGLDMQTPTDTQEQPKELPERPLNRAERRAQKYGHHRVRGSMFGMNSNVVGPSGILPPLTRKTRKKV